MWTMANDDDQSLNRMDKKTNVVIASGQCFDQECDIIANNIRLPSATTELNRANGRDQQQVMRRAVGVTSCANLIINYYCS